MFWHFFALKILHKLLDLLLFFIWLLIEVLFERLIDLRVLFLSFSLILLEFVLFFHVRPDAHFVDEIREEFVCFDQSTVESWLLVDLLELVSVHIDKESIGVGVTGHGKQT